jgi:serine/threonine protein kinase
LDRAVAIKIPRPHLVSGPAALASFLAEARVLASIDHPNIVPVYDFGRTDDGLCYVVSKYVEGSDLASRIKQARLPVAESAWVAAVVADALYYAHLKGLVHRDVKPANILIRVGGRPYLCDFGLALRAEVLEKKSNWAGTPAYMSPEQARGDVHQIDGRSDIFSLGIVLYQLLTGQLPFQGPSLEELLVQITTAQVRRPRELDDSIPLELERICLKTLAKPMPERYTTALELAEDLQAYRLQPAQPQRTFPERTQGSVTVLSLCMHGSAPEPSTAVSSWQVRQRRFRGC